MKVHFLGNYKPAKGKKDDTCYDLIARTMEVVQPGVIEYKLGVSLQVAPPHKLGFELRSRSSIHKTGLILSNGVGTIDAGYTGELSVVFYHVIPTLEPYKVGDRVCQLKLDPNFEIDFEHRKELVETTRGDSGYGSTGNI